MTFMATNEFQQRARERKAMALVVQAAKAFDGRGFTADQLAEFDQTQRDMLAAVAGTNPPSEATWELVVSSTRVRRRDIDRAADPFDGI